MRCVLVTGAMGFVGRQLVPALARTGAVRAAVRRRPEAGLPPQVEIAYHPDLAQSVDWAPLVSGAEAIVHLAGIAHVGPQIPESLYERVNARATDELAKAAQRAGVRRLIFISSIRAQSGPTADHVLTEDSDPRPTDAYGRSKLAAENAIKASGAPYTILRPVLIYGPGVKGNLATLARIAALPLPLPFGGFDNRRSVLAVGNLVSAIQFVLRTAATEGQTYIVADPRPISLRNMIAALRRGLGRSAGLFSVPARPLGQVLRAFGKADTWARFGGELVADPAKLINAGWSPATDTEAALGIMAGEMRPG